MFLVLPLTLPVNFSLGVHMWLLLFCFVNAYATSAFKQLHVGMKKCPVHPYHLPVNAVGVITGIWGLSSDLLRSVSS